MNTMHDDAARDALETWMSAPEGAQILASICARIRAGEFHAWYLDVVGQDHRRPPHRWEMEQIAMFAQVHVDSVGGKIGRTDIGLWDSPANDRNRTANQQALDQLPAPFHGHVDGEQHGADSDGWVEWSEPIRVSVTTNETEPGTEGRPRPKTKIVMVEPRRVPLEIGTTKPSRTLQHVREGCGVARWPYGHERAQLLLNMEHLLPEVVWSRDVEQLGCSCHHEHGRVAMTRSVTDSRSAASRPSSRS